MGRVLSIDLGKKRVGLALSDPSHLISQPYKTIAFVSWPGLLAELKIILKEKDVEEVIVGLPIKENGEEGEGCADARYFLSLLAKEHIQACLWDERYSSRLAENVLRTYGKKIKDNKEKIDQIAASFILEGYLKSRK
jgi:putative Holliday junction resolvase